MTFQDTWAICTKCGDKFVFRVEDQRRLSKQGQEITPPPLCPSCKQSGGMSIPSSGGETRAQPAPKESQELERGPHEGQVKWYDNDKGYGFIVHPDGEEIFFHRTGIAPGETPNFTDGAAVTYCVEQTSKGPQAIEVERMDTG